MKKISVFITTLNNELTLPYCLQSVKWADEIVVLDSFSTDKTVDIARENNAKVFQHEFLGYGPQKQSALEKTTGEWALLLDADEAVTPELQQEIQQLLSSEPQHDGYDIPRREQLFWRMSSRYVPYNGHLRLFKKSSGGMSTEAVHADPKVRGTVGRLRYPFLHFGEVNIHTKVAKINDYSSGMVEEKAAQGKKGILLTCIFYPFWVFLQSYVIKRSFINGGAGFINSVVMAHYAFLKYAKLYEWYKVKALGRSMLPPGSPDTLKQPDVPK